MKCTETCEKEKHCDHKKVDTGAKFKDKAEFHEWRS